DQEAFFSLLDEYFASRPHLLSQSSSNSISPTLQRPPSTSSRILPPAPSPMSPRSLPPAHSPSNTNTYPQSPPTETTSQNDKPDMTTRFVVAGIKHGTSGAKTGLGMVAKNTGAMGALDKAGMGGLVRGADRSFNSNKDRNKVEETQTTQTGGKKGVSGLTFGHVDTSSGMSAFKSMWKDPQKVKTPTVEHYQPSALSHSQANLPPPPRRSVQTVEVIATETETMTGEGQALALYDYVGADEGDLGVQKGQIVNVLEKTSDDWWTCEDGNGQRGLVPAAYLKET
ncbi:hypothetical protein TREMEDRAFT_24523, partial [Tremella mesenterica DSM 1558]|uniref:uncharacterized protein n=1 Tax=Tremella mesenterica (strain ATCC 24925 / CBS 8224 / DSM 1558 / NBRC 9311 / NRRL Y-6157 / RJB 2259-6 / UBC 559-6) TaxID=578456 RepID=UPI0003F48DD5